MFTYNMNLDSKPCTQQVRHRAKGSCRDRQVCRTRFKIARGSIPGILFSFSENNWLYDGLQQRHQKGFESLTSTHMREAFMVSLVYTCVNFLL